MSCPVWRHIKNIYMENIEWEIWKITAWILIVKFRELKLLELTESMMRIDQIIIESFLLPFQLISYLSRNQIYVLIVGKYITPC